MNDDFEMNNFEQRDHNCPTSMLDIQTSGVEIDNCSWSPTDDPLYSTLLEEHSQTGMTKNSVSVIANTNATV